MNKIFRPTVAIYNDAVSYCVEAFENEWADISSLDALQRKPFAESLIHSTKNNKAKYDFDDRFYKMPSYMRRSVVNTSLGYLSSYHSNLENWHSNGSVGKKPVLQKHLNKFPTFYKDVMFQNDLGNDSCMLKLFVDSDWIWVSVKLRHNDIQYIRKHMSDAKMSVPTLEKKHHKWFLRFAFEEEITLKKTDINEQKILAVDFGINTDAVCSVMKSDGTVLARKFIDFAGDKDLIFHTLNKIKKFSRKYGSHNTKGLWRYASMHNIELSRKIAKAVTDYAVLQNVDVIVFAYTDAKGRIYGTNKQILHLWRSRSIQNLIEHKAHRNGIRISRVCGKGASKLAFDGSGTVVRDKDNYKLCTF